MSSNNRPTTTSEQSTTVANCENSDVIHVPGTEEARLGGLGGWKEEEEQLLPSNNIPLVFFALLLTTFLVSVTPHGNTYLLNGVVYYAIFRQRWMRPCKMPIGPCRLCDLHVHS